MWYSIYHLCFRSLLMIPSIRILLLNIWLSIYLGLTWFSNLIIIIILNTSLLLVIKEVLLRCSFRKLWFILSKLLRLISLGITNRILLIIILHRICSYRLLLKVITLRFIKYIKKIILCIIILIRIKVLIFIRIMSISINRIWVNFYLLRISMYCNFMWLIIFLELLILLFICTLIIRILIHHIFIMTILILIIRLTIELILLLISR